MSYKRPPPGGGQPTILWPKFSSPVGLRMLDVSKISLAPFPYNKKSRTYGTSDFSISISFAKNILEVIHTITWGGPLSWRVPSHERTGSLPWAYPWTSGPLIGGDPLIGLDRSHDFEMRGPPVRGPGVHSIEGSRGLLTWGDPCDLLRQITWGVRSCEATSPLLKINKFLTFDSNSTSDS